MEIINLVNKYRAENNLPELKLSASLSYVADVHAKDLFINKPHEGCGSLNSWSNKGRWNKLCYNKSKTAFKDMKNKPSELTQYKGQSIELVYYSSENYTATEVLNAWKQNPQCNNLILNKQPFAATKWLVIGAGYFEGYLCVWFGPLEDKLSDVAKCEEQLILEDVIEETVVEVIELNDDIEDDFEDQYQQIEVETHLDNVEHQLEKEEVQQIEEVIIETQEKWHVIVAVVSGDTSAENAVNDMINLGYKNSSAILIDDGTSRYRISAGSFVDKEEAEIIKTELEKKGYKGTWLLKK